MRKPRPIQPPESYDHCRQYLSAREFAKLDYEMKRGLPPVPRFELDPDFLSPAEAAAFSDQLCQLPNYKFESGSCTIEPTHLTVQFGPRQAYNQCVPTIYRVVSSGEIPDFIEVQKLRAEEKYDCVFNSAQINLHPNNGSQVFPHKDSNPGHICQLSVGATRLFTLSYGMPIFHRFAHVPLTSGSLLTFFPREQHRMFHEMKRSETPCGMKFSVIFRYIPEILTRTFIKNAKSAADARQIRKERDEEYEAAQIAGRERRRAAVK
jgi:hypothetical protein